MKKRRDKYAGGNSCLPQGSAIPRKSEIKAFLKQPSKSKEDCFKTVCHQSQGIMVMVVFRCGKRVCEIHEVFKKRKQNRIEFAIFKRQKIPNLGDKSRMNFQYVINGNNTVPFPVR